MMSRYEQMSLEELKAELETQKAKECSYGTEDNLPTQEDINQRNELYEKALEIGVNLMMTDDTGKDNYYRDLALLYIIEGKEVPQELREKIAMEDQKLKEDAEE